MINKIRLANFKAFGDAVELDIKPITILCGTNSSGKSSILQSMLLLKQTFDSKRPESKLTLNGRFVQLGSIEDVIHNHDKDKKITLSFEHKLLESAKDSESMFALLNNIFGNVKNNRINNINYSCVYLFEWSAGKKRKRNSSVIPTIVERFNFKIYVDDVSNDNNIIEVDAVLQKSANYKITVSFPNTNRHVKDVIRYPFVKGGTSFITKLSFINLIPQIDSFGFKDKVESENFASVRNRNISRQFVSRIFDTVRESVQELFTTYRYIGPLRGAPSRRYIYEEEINEIGVKGENAAYIFQEDENKKIKNYYLYDKQSNKFQFHHSGVNLSTLTRRVLDSMGIKNFGFTNNENIVKLTLQSNSSEKTKVNIADVGFGVSQLFPIVLEGLRMDVNDTLLLEQPEIHLHPNLQMQLADYLISLALSKKNVIVETHSDHFINRLVRRVVEDIDNNLANLIQIYFVKSSASGSELETVQVDSKNGINNWPEGFFDQNMSEQQMLLQAILAKELGTDFTNIGTEVFNQI